ncbi:KIF1-binding [Phytophthora citrophthora]|uniref:KIF1-binding n=1 Tax=Phytophthora citrophthora TaxID=4793 RepID=A0AAD9LET1_9STRA|nr:KIF1-binding [Phytophthora citrophthora]
MILNDSFCAVDAQPALEEAGNFFFPELVKFTTDITADDGSEGQTEAKESVQKLLKEIPQVKVKNEHEEFLTYVVELLNQLGVLWTNRSRLLRALCYLSAGQKLCDKHKKQDEALAAAQTHAHFYLAQVYGSLGMADESARFCLSTLELQLLQCVNAEGEGALLERMNGCRMR